MKQNDLIANSDRRGEMQRRRQARNAPPGREQSEQRRCTKATSGRRPLRRIPVYGACGALILVLSVTAANPAEANGSNSTSSLPAPTTPTAVTPSNTSLSSVGDGGCAQQYTGAINQLNTTSGIISRRGNRITAAMDFLDIGYAAAEGIFVDLGSSPPFFAAQSISNGVRFIGDLIQLRGETKTIEANKLTNYSSGLPNCDQKFAGTVTVQKGGLNVTGSSIFNGHVAVAGSMTVAGPLAADQIKASQGISADGGKIWLGDTNGTTYSKGITLGGGALSGAGYGGAEAYTGDPSAIAVGNNAQADRAGSLAVGLNAVASGVSGTAVGDSAQAQGASATALGDAAQAYGASATAVGDGAQAHGASATALGDAAQAYGASATAVGDSAQAYADNTVAIGAGALVMPGAGPGAFAGGTSLVLGGAGAVSIGDANAALGDGAVAIGDPNVAMGTGAVAIGASNTATSSGAVAAGNLNTAGGQGAVATGNMDTATGQGAIAIGDQNVATGVAAIAEGQGSNATADGAIALGQGTTADATDAIALGQGANAVAKNATAIGQGSNAEAPNSTAIGPGATVAVEDVNSTAIGAGATTSYDNQIVLGTASQSVTMPGIDSALSRSRQIGGLGLVTTDALGNLASDGGALFKHLATTEAGVAIAFALPNPIVTSSRRHGIMVNAATYYGAYGLGISAADFLGTGLLKRGDSLALSGAIGWGKATEQGYTESQVGARVGLEYSW